MRPARQWAKNLGVSEEVIKSIQSETLLEAIRAISYLSERWQPNTENPLPSDCISIIRQLMP